MVVVFGNPLKSVTKKTSHFQTINTHAHQTTNTLTKKQLKKKKSRKRLKSLKEEKQKKKTKQTDFEEGKHEQILYHFKSSKCINVLYPCVFIVVSDHERPNYNKLNLEQSIRHKTTENTNEIKNKTQSHTILHTKPKKKQSKKKKQATS